MVKKANGISGVLTTQTLANMLKSGNGRQMIEAIQQIKSDRRLENVFIAILAYADTEVAECILHHMSKPDIEGCTAGDLLTIRDFLIPFRWYLKGKYRSRP
jgi:hypothetical protein